MAYWFESQYFPLWVVDNQCVSSRPRPVTGPGGSVQLPQTAIAVVVVVVANIFLTDVSIWMMWQR